MRQPTPSSKALRLALVAGLGALIVTAFAPIDTFEALFIFFFGLSLGPWVSGEATPADDRTPVLEWDEMHEGERFAHFLPEVFMSVVAVIMTALAIHSSRIEVNWGMIASAALMIGLSAYSSLDKWQQRYG